MNIHFEGEKTIIGRGANAFLLLVALCAVNSVWANTGAHPPAPAHLYFEPIEENPYFVQDSDDPRLLRPAPSADEEPIDRRYIEKMARPKIDPQVFDMLDSTREKPVGLIKKLEETTLKNIVLDGNILIVEGDEGATLNTPSGIVFDHGGGGLETVVNGVWSVLGDQYDFITVFSTYTDSSVAAYYMPLQQTTTGLGACDFNSGQTFGCIFSQLGPDAMLQGFIYMNSVAYWRNWDLNYDGKYHSFDSFDASVFAVLGQETAHRWGAGLRFLQPETGAINTDLLGRDLSHWAAWVNSDASVMDGWEWFPETDGSFTLIDDMDGFWTLDLYAMGALAVNDTEPFFYIDNARFVANSFVGNQWVPAEAALQVPSVDYLTENGVTLQATGDKVNLTIGDISSAEGVRCPDPDHAQKAFRQLFVLVTRPGETASQVSNDLAQLEQIRATWEKWWLDRTRKLVTICTEPGRPCIHPYTILSGGSLSKDADDIMPGDTFNLSVKSYVYDMDREGAEMGFRVEGSSADQISLSETSKDLGTILSDDVKSSNIDITVDDDYPCGEMFLVKASLSSDNAETLTVTRRFYPGYEYLFFENFDGEDDDFEVSGDPQSGAFVRSLLQTSCEMSHRTPSRDDSPGGLSAFVTGEAADLDGESTLTSPSIDLEGASDPILRFSYWLRGEGTMQVSLAGDNGEWSEARLFENDNNYNEWARYEQNIWEVLGPDTKVVTVRIVAEGEGEFEVGVDEFMIAAPVGKCAPETPMEDEALWGGCACRHSETRAQSFPWTVLALLFLFLRKRENTLK